MNKKEPSHLSADVPLIQMLPKTGSQIAELQLDDSNCKEPNEISAVRPRWTLGILNDHSGHEVPGTVLLLPKTKPSGNRPSSSDQSSAEIFNDEPINSAIGNLKRAVDGKMVLRPQPDDSPNDPLNWPARRRSLALYSLGCYCMLGGGMTPVLAAGFKAISQDLEVAVTHVALTTGSYMLGCGCGSVVLSPIAIIYGKRPVYLAAASGLVLTAIWCALSPNFISLIAARTVMGFAISSVECLPSSSIGEMFFLHEKAFRLGIYTLLLLSGKNLIPLIGAVVVQRLGWRWVFWITALAATFCLFLLVAFVPETFWNRTPAPRGHNQIMTENTTALSYTETQRRRPLNTRRQRLQFLPGKMSHVAWYRVTMQPFALFGYPNILWSAAVYATSLGWLIILSESVSLIYQTQSAYNFTDFQAGLVYLGPFTGAVLGSAIAGKLSDAIVRYMASQNNGIYEPEFRLVMAVPVAIFTTVGLMGFGWSAQIHDNWLVPTFFFGCIALGCALGSSTAIIFAIDSHQEFSGEALVTMCLSKNIFLGFLFSLFFDSWLENEGSKPVFLVLGGVQLVCMLATVPMYIFGKRCRRRIALHAK